MATTNSQYYSVDGTRIKAMRLMLRHWRQKDLAKAANVSPGQISRIEHNLHHPHLRTVERIAAALEVDPDELITWHIEKP